MLELVRTENLMVREHLGFWQPMTCCAISFCSKSLVERERAVAEMVTARACSAAFWRRRRVLLTGHTGFKGSWLALWLLELGAEVVGFSNAVPTERAFFQDMGLASDMADMRGDVRDLDALRKVVDRERPDIVLHLAAQPLVRASYDDPVETYATNVMGSVNVLEAVRRSRTVEVTLIVTSDKCLRESGMALGVSRKRCHGWPRSTAAARAAPSLSRRLTRAPSSVMVVASGWCRPGRATSSRWRLGRGSLGPGSRARLRDEHTGGEPPSWGGSPLAARARTPVRYLLLCECAAAERQISGQGWNFGPNATGVVTVRELADRICALWPRRDGWVDVSGGHHRHEAHLLSLDSTKARTLLGCARAGPCSRHLKRRLTSTGRPKKASS